MEANKRTFFTGYSQLAGRPGDLYVMRKSNCWHVNAGVDSCGHDPGFGVVFDVVDGTPELESFEEFFKQTTRVQQFIINELGATQQSCNRVFQEIWDYIHQNTKPQISEKQERLSVQIESAKVKLASYFSQEIVDTASREFNMYCRIEGLSVTAETDFGRRTTIAQAKDENELFFKVIKEITKTCAQKYEQIHRAENSSAWRYIRSKVVDGHWMYTENVNYKYNAIEDTRKVWFEKHICAMAIIFSVDSVGSLISEYTRLINGWFSDSHWAFNSDLMEFVETSSSKERDTDKKEHPQPHEILK